MLNTTNCWAKAVAVFDTECVLVGKRLLETEDQEGEQLTRESVTLFQNNAKRLNVKKYVDTWHYYYYLINVSNRDVKREPENR